MPENSHKMIAWRYQTAYDIFEDAIMTRVSGFDERSQEHWMKVRNGKGWRDRRDDAACIIQAAIERGEPPGEVEWVDLDEGAIT
jgi:hypothetical protein